jgi:hypothetical protein
VSEPPPLVLVEPYEVEDARLAELAALALVAISERLAVEADREAVIASVVEEVFGEIDPARAVAAVPHSTPGEDEWVPALVRDPTRLDRIVRTVLEILDDPDLARDA